MPDRKSLVETMIDRIIPQWNEIKGSILWVKILPFLNFFRSWYVLNGWIVRFRMTLMVNERKIRREITNINKFTHQEAKVLEQEYALGDQ
jgi:hypothetical protein